MHAYTSDMYTHPTLHLRPVRTHANTHTPVPQYIGVLLEEVRSVCSVVTSLQTSQVRQLLHIASGRRATTVQLYATQYTSKLPTMVTEASSSMAVGMMTPPYRHADY